MAATSEIDECFSRHEGFKYEIWMTLHIYPGFVIELQTDYFQLEALHLII